MTIIRFYKKSIYHTGKYFAILFSFLSRRLAINMFINLLKFVGVKINGTPRFIAFDVKLDNFDLAHDKYLSDKIKILSAISICLVLYIHTSFSNDEISQMKLMNYVQIFIAEQFGHCSVPLFYIISGYLFFLKIPNGMNSIFQKMKKRIQTLLIPYIISAIFFVIFYSIIEIMPGANKFLNNSVIPLFSKDLSTILLSIFYASDTGYPIAFQLWFLRDLMILVLFSPILYLLLKYLRWRWVLLAFLLNYIPITHFPVFALFWFSLGGFLVKVDITVKKSKIGIYWTILFLVLCALQMLYSDLLWWKFVKIPFLLLGVISIWTIYGLFVPKLFLLQQHKCLVKICSFSFFIYLFHEPTLNIVKKLIVFVVGKNEIGYLISFLISPWIFIVFAVIVGSTIKKVVPKFYGIVVGGRLS